MAATGANMNPRKFAEKIALHNQKGAEETAEFQKIMSECAAVKGGAPKPQVPQQHAPPLMVVGAGAGLPHPGRVHLSPNFSSVPRHGSLPNVNAGVTCQMPVMMAGPPDPVLLGMNAAGGPQTPGTPGGSKPDIAHIPGLQASASTRTSISGTNLLASANAPGSEHMSVRDTLSGGGHQQHGHTGPIRQRHRKDTSPYSSDRGQGSGGSSSHLSPPDTSWRRVVSDSSLHHSVLGTNPGGSNLVSPAGSTGDIVGDHPALLGSNGAISPLQEASPTMHRRVPYATTITSPLQNPATDKRTVNQLSSYLLSPLPKDSGDLKPGSLPDLTNFHVGQPNPGGDPVQMAPGTNMNIPGGPGGGGQVVPGGPMPTGQPTPMENDDGSPSFSTSLPVNVGLPSYEPNQGSSSNFVRLSDTEISKILSIPVSLVSDNSNTTQTSQDLNNHVADKTSSNSNKQQHCDNSNRNLLHLSKGVAIDQKQQQQQQQQQPPGYNNYMYQNYSNEAQQQQQKGDMHSMSKYRNPQSIPQPASPLIPVGSPLGRSTSPIDILGSPHSPANTVNSSLGNSAPIYPDAMTLAGQGYQTSQQQMDLANKFQRVSMLEPSSPGGSSDHSGVSYGGAQSLSSQMPTNEFNFFNTDQTQQQQQQQQHHGAQDVTVGQYNSNQVSSPNPKTPSSIPDIILTDDAGTDQALQKVLGISNNMSYDLDCFSTDEFKEGLGKLDDTMIRLLHESGSMDQQIADPATEEHLTTM